MRRLLFALLMFIMSSITTCFAQTPRIHSIEQLPYFCGARLNVLLSDFGPGHSYLEYCYRVEGNSSWSAFQKSSTFLFSKERLAIIGRKTLAFRVRERRYWSDDIIDKITIEPSNVSITVDTRSENPNCDDAAGVAEVIINGGWRYLTFDGTTSTIVNMPTRFLDNLKAFTMEGDIRLTQDVSSLKGLVGVFGIDNVLEFGFRDGRPAAYICYDKPVRGSGVFDFNSAFLMPNDHEWHNMVVRSDGSKMQILIDGNEYAGESKPIKRLKPDRLDQLHNLTIGAKVWRQDDDGLKGDISRVSFWNRALTNDELRNLRANPPKGNEAGLLAAYNLGVRNETKLFPTLKRLDGETDAEFADRNEKCTGIITGAKWSDNVYYVLKKKDEKTNVYKQIGEEGHTNSAVVTGLRAGTYQFIATYNAGECDETVTTPPFSLKSTYELGAKIDITQGRNLCEGDEITLNVVKETGGSNLVGVFLKYQWEVSGDLKNYVEIPGATSKHVRHDVSFGKNNYRVRVQTSDGVCKANSDTLLVTSNKKIFTKPIKRIK